MKREILKYVEYNYDFRDYDLQSQVKVMLRPMVSRTVCLGVKHPSGAQDQICVAVRQLRVCWFGASSLTGLSFRIAAGPRQCSHSLVRVTRDSWPYSTLSDSRLPQPGGPGPRIYIPQEQGGWVIPLGSGFLFVASYNTQGYSGVIRTRIHTGFYDSRRINLLYPEG
jgi:hypothetical protein